LNWSRSFESNWISAESLSLSITYFLRFSSIYSLSLLSLIL
jgi:hypothetical protein